MRVLVIDDDSAIRHLLSEILMGEGCYVRTADCGETALRMFAEEPFKLVILDVRMPGMSGIEVLHRLKHRNVQQSSGVKQ